MLALTRHSTLTLFVCAGFLFGGLMLGPDLDTHSIHYKRWSIFRWIWLPYRYSLRHRSPWSHGPIMGTTVRVLYLLFWVGLLSLLSIAAINEIGQFSWSWSQIGNLWAQPLQHYRLQAIALCIGLELGAFSHYSADWLVSSYKRVRSKGLRALWSQPKRKRRKSRSARRR
ncbi:MAG: metal-binding protein [Elainellaceae cyanobacterium]